MDWKLKLIELSRSKRIFWRIIAGTSILISLTAGSAFFLKDLLKEILK